MGTWSILHWLVVLAIIVLIFGTGKISKAGKDLGEAIRGFKGGFKEAMVEDKDAIEQDSVEADAQLGQNTQEPVNR